LNFSSINLKALEDCVFDPRFNRFDIVDISNNNIVSVQNISGLKSIYSGKLEATLQDLSVFNLSSNPLKRLESGDFVRFQYLRVLDLSYNQISFIHRKSFGSSNIVLESIILNGNPIDMEGCTCGYKFFCFTKKIEKTSKQRRTGKCNVERDTSLVY
jgi:hypothetical protein